ncbi:hypothetical protein GM3708_1026 [Geminocystis sp. NIES-3708]|uniref:MAE_28990/MAE_18760 family HEPN-like nuclease n=1 Tax=Geminocystis sp. NIES-3708 TaxID=1615909 RepID=UPI0005FCB363|nr:MAE_28990/MAE_18760 family HEPN-like nuclease [Geminocystis sp. NIES-3708]BAQ60620.1 hypothetical protein GM3708_1026 [Geminocystis sp. NIES-3708]
MQTVLDDFNQRAKEVTDYIDFVKNLEEQEKKATNDHYLSIVKVNLLTTLKATAYLLLYNLVESTIRNATQLIFDEIITREINFDDLRREIKKFIWKNVRDRDKNFDRFIENTNHIIKDLVNQQTLDTDKMFSGNLDSKAIKTISEKFLGFSTETKSQKTWDGKDLRSIKDNRNDLAHGLKSFSDIGKDVSSNEICQISERVIEYLKQILENIDHYLANEEYLESNVKR